jgi:hypothetical protein
MTLNFRSADTLDRLEGLKLEGLLIIVTFLKGPRK